MALHYPLKEEEIERMNEEFFRLYGTDHWFYKIKTFNILLNSTEQFVWKLGDEELQEKPVEDYRRAIKSEIVATFYHISESLFILMGVCNSVLPWVQMKHIKMEDIEEFVEETIVEKELDDEELKQIFYPGVRPAEEHEGTMEDSFGFIREYLARMGGRYLDRDIYNEYKHGLRLSTTESSFRIAPEKEFMGETGPVALERGGTSHVYLEEELFHKDDSEDYKRLNKVTSGFDYELFLDLCITNYLLIDQIIQIRRSKISGDPEAGEEVQVTSFHEFDVDEITDYDASKQWEFKFSYQVGEEGITIG